MSYLSLTSWSLHRSLGPLRMSHWDPQLEKTVIDEVYHPEIVQLLELPAIAAARGIRALDVCHFHFPNTTSEYLNQLREAFLVANVRFNTLLVDYGDISSADEVRRASDTAYIEGWIKIARTVGAECVRVVAGESDASDRRALERSASSLIHLMEYASTLGVSICTENFRSLASTPENCMYLKNECGPHLSMIADFGNFKSEHKYSDLAQIIPYAENIHAKAHYDEHGLPDEVEFIRCLETLKVAGYSGPITIVFDGPGDEWEGISRVKAIIENHIELVRDLA